MAENEEKKEKKAKKEKTEKVKSGGGGKILAFFLGVLFGIILLIGGVVGAGYFVASTDLDKVLGWFNLDNSPDENGDNKYINTDVDNGGVNNIIELVQKVISLANNIDNMTLGEIDDLVPAARGLVDQIIESVQDYVIVDYDELSAVKFSEFEAYFSDLVLDIRPAVIVEKSGSGEINKLMDLVLYGVEADCITKNGILCPLYQDTVTKTYIYQYNNNWYVAEESNGVFTATDTQYTSYNKNNTEATGNYYTVNGERQFIDPITLRSFIGTDGLGALGKTTVAELIGDMSEGDSELVEKIFGNIILDDLINGNIDLEEKINDLEIGLLLDFDPFNDDMLLYIAYALSDLSETADDDGFYSAVYKLGETDIPVLVSIEDNKITKIIDAATGEELSGTTVSTIGQVIDNIEITVLINVAPTNKVLTYIAYGLTGVEQTAEGWRGYYNGQLCTINVGEDGNITAVYNEETGGILSAAGIDELNDRLNTVTEDLTIGDIVEIREGDKIMSKLAGYKINEVSDAVQTFELGDIMDIEASSTLMAYLAYGITKVDAVAGEAQYQGETVRVETSLNEVGTIVITGVYHLDGTAIEGTKVGEMTDRMEGLKADVTIGELMSIDESSSNTIMKAIKNSTINSLSDDIDKLTINELYAESIYGTAELKTVVASGAGEGELDFNTEYLYYEMVDGDYKLVDGTGKVEAYRAGLYTYGATTGLWKLLVVERAGGGKTEKAYTINSITAMADNATKNLRECSLSELYEAGILTFEVGTENPLDKLIPNIEGIAYKNERLGDLTITQAIVAIASLMDYINR